MMNGQTESINRTSVELKLRLSCCNHNAVLCINRTSVELKLSQRISLHRRSCRINRTSVELKQGIIP